MQKTGSIGADEVQHEAPPGRHGCDTRAIDADLQRTVVAELRERVAQRIGFLVGNADLHDACELPAEARHLTAFPVPTVRFDDTGDRINEAGTVVTDDGEDEGRHGATLLNSG